MLKARLQKEEWEGLPDDVKEHYVEKDGVYCLGVTPTDGLELMNPTQLKKTLQKERASASEAEKARKALEASIGGMDLEAAAAAIKTVEEMAGMDPEGKAKTEREAFEKLMTDKFEADRKALVEKHKGESDTTAKARQILEAQLEQQLIAASASKAIADAGGSVDLLLPIVRGHTKMKPEQDGTFGVVIRDKDGMERLSPVAGSTNPMSIEELVGELKGNKTYARAFDSSGASGSGAGRTGAAGSSGSAGYTITKADAKDTRKYRAAKEAADKAHRDLVITDA